MMKRCIFFLSLFSTALFAETYDFFLYCTTYDKEDKFRYEIFEAKSDKPFTIDQLKREDRGRYFYVEAGFTGTVNAQGEVVFYGSRFQYFEKLSASKTPNSHASKNIVDEYSADVKQGTVPADKMFTVSSLYPSDAYQSLTFQFDINETESLEALIENQAPSIENAIKIHNEFLGKTLYSMAHLSFHEVMGSSEVIIPHLKMSVELKSGKYLAGYPTHCILQSLSFC